MGRHCSRKAVADNRGAFPSLGSRVPLLPHRIPQARSKQSYQIPGAKAGDQLPVDASLGSESSWVFFPQPKSC